MNESISSSAKLIEVFNHAQTLAAGEERRRCLDEACGCDVTLRAEVGTTLTFTVPAPANGVPKRFFRVQADPHP